MNKATFPRTFFSNSVTYFHQLISSVLFMYCFYRYMTRNFITMNNGSKVCLIPPLVTNQALVSKPLFLTKIMPDLKSQKHSAEQKN